MKQFIIISILLLTFKTAYSQNSSVEKSIFSFQTIGLGTWINNESRLSNSIALRSEFGVEGGIGGASDVKTRYALTPVITLEPRWYYNIKSRFKKNRNTANNGADFFSLAISFYPDWFVISNVENISTPANQVAFIPKWSIRRNFGRTSNFNYEVGIGLGSSYVFLKELGYAQNKWQETGVLNLRLGCSFTNSKKG